jgi:hypothetical protein
LLLSIFSFTQLAKCNQRFTECHRMNEGVLLLSTVDYF